MEIKNAAVESAEVESVMEEELKESVVSSEKEPTEYDLILNRVKTLSLKDMERLSKALVGELTKKAAAEAKASAAPKVKAKAAKVVKLDADGNVMKAPDRMRCDREWQEYLVSYYQTHAWPEFVFNPPKADYSVRMAAGEEGEDGKFYFPDLMAEAEDGTLHRATFTRAHAMALGPKLACDDEFEAWTNFAAEYQPDEYAPLRTKKSAEKAAKHEKCLEFEDYVAEITKKQEEKKSKRITIAAKKEAAQAKKEAKAAKPAKVPKAPKEPKEPKKAAAKSKKPVEEAAVVVNKPAAAAAAAAPKRRAVPAMAKAKAIRQWNQSDLTSETDSKQWYYMDEQGKEVQCFRDWYGGVWGLELKNGKAVMTGQWIGQQYEDMTVDYTAPNPMDAQDEDDE